MGVPTAIGCRNTLGARKRLADRGLLNPQTIADGGQAPRVVIL
jgi:hypothetical protein